MNKIIILSLLIPGISHAAVTLIVNTATKTLSWSGSATSSVIAVPFGSQANVGITTGVSNTYNGGLSATSAVQSGPGLAMTVASGVTTVPPSDNPSAGTVYSNTTTGTGGPIVSALIGAVLFIDGVNESTFTVTGNPISYDYSTLGAAEEAFLESQDGVRLFFSDAITQSDWGTAGSILVVSVPEPQSLFFGFLGLFGLATQRKRR